MSAVVIAAGLSQAPLVTASPAANGGHTDWVMIVVTAGPHGAAKVRWTDELTTTAAYTAQVLVGEDAAVYDPERQDHPDVACGFVWQFDGSPGGVSTNGRPGTSDNPPPQRWYTKGDGTIAHLDPGERLAQLWFFAGGELTRRRMDAVAGSGTVTVVHLSGRGARGIALNNGTPTPDGGVANSGSARLEADAPTGWAGSFVTADNSENAAAFRSTSITPDGTTRSFAQPPQPTAGCQHAAPTFAAGAGHWQWTWQGASQQPAELSVAGWAPVGRYWRLFDAPPPPPDPVAFYLFPFMLRPEIRAIR